MARFILATLLALWSGEVAAIPAQERPKSPNVILIVADDLGWGELGSYGQKKIKTPRLDMMAERGVRFTQFYSGSPVCAPSRCVLMTGLHSGHAFIRSNKETKPEGQLPIPADAVTLVRLFKNRGYVTGLVGKWGLGMFGTTGDPLKHGFDFFYGYNCQRHAHSFYPTYLWRDGKREILEGNDIKGGPHYSHDLMEAESLKFIRAHKDRPFFLYLPYTIPHVALQIPDEELKGYRGLWPETPYVGNKGYQPHPTPRAAYAAMITRLDKSVGKILDLLEELQIDDDTIVMFTSDNGATHDGTGGADCVFFNSTGPLRGFKGSLFEGGVRVPLIVYWKGRAPGGRTTSHVAAFQDIMPTLSELCGLEAPKNIDGISMLPTILGRGTQRTHPYLYFEFPSYGGQQAVRVADWKAIRQNLQKGMSKLQLFNLALDIGEQNDVAAQHRDVIERIERIMAENHVPSAEFPIKALDKKKLR
jgi:arylsulfatase A